MSGIFASVASGAIAIALGVKATPRHPQTALLASMPRYVSWLLLHHRQDERRWIFCAVVQRVLADLVRLVVMRPQDVRDRRVAVRDLQADAIALLELERVRLDA